MTSLIPPMIICSDNLVYRLERLPTGEYVVESGYPKSTASWNFPNGISPDDTVTTLSGIVYFFFGDRYYIYYNNDVSTTHQVEHKF